MSKVAVAAVASTAATLLILGALLLGTGKRSTEPHAADRERNEQGQDSETPVPLAFSEAEPREGSDSGPSSRPPARQAVTDPLATVTVSGEVRNTWGSSEDQGPVPEVLVRLLRRRSEAYNLPPPPADADRASTDAWMRQALEALRRVGLQPPEEELSRVVTDAGGAFTLQGRLPATGLPAGLVLRAEKSGWLDVEGLGIPLEVTSFPFEKTGLVYRMALPLSVAGRVIDAVDGKPIRGARVYLDPGVTSFVSVLPGPVPTAVTTEEEGRFQLDLGPFHSAALVVEAAAFLPGLTRLDRSPGPGEMRIRLLPVSAAAMIRGTVFEAGGGPAEGAEVKLSAAWRSEPRWRDDDSASRDYFEQRVLRPGVRSAPDGTFTILLAYGGSWMLTAERAGQQGSATVTVAAGVPAICRIELDSFRVAGLIVDEDSGEPIPGARVRGDPAEPSSGRHAPPTPGRPNPTMTTTDEAGRFLIDLGGTRNATLLVEADEYFPGSAAVSRTAATTQIRVSLVRASGAPWLRGIVLDPSGIPGAQVPLQIERGSGANPGARGGSRPGSLDHFERRVLQPGLMTSADGTFAVQLPYAGSWKVTARRGALEKSVSVTLGAGEDAFCRLELELFSCRISGRVVDEKDAPVAATVYVRWEGGFLGTTSREGRFDLRVSPRNGPFRVQAEHEGRRSAEVNVSLDRPGLDHDVGTLSLQPLGAR